MKWISVKKCLPDKDQPVLCYTKKGMSVVWFVSGESMFQNLRMSGIMCPDEERKKHFFCSQETPGLTLNGVTHWMYLPPNPSKD